MAGINKSINIGNKSRATNSKENANCGLDLCGIVLSLCLLSVDLVIDGVLIIEYFKQFEYHTLFFLIYHIGIIIILQILSLKSFLTKNVIDRVQWISHCFLFGITHRYISLLLSYLQIGDTNTKIPTSLHQSKHEVYKLHLLYVFAKSLPQTMMNALVLMNTKSWITSSGSSLILTSLSAVWLLIQYLRSRPIAKEALERKCRFELFWTVFILIARVSVFTLVAVCFNCWVFVFAGLHWLFGTLWIFSRSKSNGLSYATILYNCIVGISNCFALMDFDDDLKILEIFNFYVIIILEHICSITLCFVLETNVQSKLIVILTSLIISSTIMSSGIIFLYHKYYYKMNGKIKFKKKIVMDVESTGNTSGECNNKSDVCENNSRDNSNLEVDTTDRKLLLENLVARSGTPTFISTPILDENSSSDVLFYSIISSNDTEAVEDEAMDNLRNKLKRRGICSASDLRLQSEDDNLFLENIPDLSKRRGICSSVELEQYNDVLPDIKEEVISDDLKCKRKPIYVTFDNNDIEIVSVDNCEIESKISDDSKYTMILSAPSEIMSAHDYENVCAVNIAREFWGLRSWRGYSDIETWLHDDSIVRDQDNITSTVATSTSSEISSNDAFENADSFMQDNHHNEYNRRRARNLDNKEDLFSAKPYIVDQNGSLLPLGSLSPIKEEIEESPEKNESGSSLVTTIDVIRKNTDINSPRYVYHRTENILESPSSNKTVYKPRSLWLNENITQISDSLPKSTKPIYENHSIIRNKLIAKSKILMKLCDNELMNCDNFTNIMYLDKPIISSSLQSLVSSSSSEDILSISEIARCFPVVRKPTGRPRRKFSLIRDRFEMTLQKKVELNSDLGSNVEI